MINVNKNFQKKIFIASDHAGYDLKQFILAQLKNSNFIVEDLGCNSPDISVDYPLYANILSEKIKSANEIGILICGSGIGISIAANRFKHIRAALCNQPILAKLSREHNDANVLCLGARIVDEKTSIEILENFLNTDFAAGRHEKRVDQLGK